MVDKKVVCQVCGGPVAGCHSLTRGWWRQPIDPETGEGADMSLSDIDWDDFDFDEVICVNHSEHDCGVRLNPEWDGDEDMYEVRRPTEYLMVLTERGWGALTAFSFTQVTCGLRTLLASMPIKVDGPSLDEATVKINDAYRDAYGQAVKSQFVRIVVEEDN